MMCVYVYIYIYVYIYMYVYRLLPGRTGSGSAPLYNIKYT